MCSNAPAWFHSYRRRPRASGPSAGHRRYSRAMSTPDLTPKAAADSQMVVVTPTYAPDLELFRDLHQSVLRCFPPNVRHVAVVPETHRSLFRQFEGSRCEVVGVREVLPVGPGPALPPPELRRRSTSAIVGEPASPIPAAARLDHSAAGETGRGKPDVGEDHRHGRLRPDLRAPRHRRDVRTGWTPTAVPTGRRSRQLASPPHAMARRRTRSRRSGCASLLRCRTT